MTFPVVESVTETNYGSPGSATVAVSMPATVAAGDMLLALCGSYGEAFSTPQGWTRLAAESTSPVRADIFYKISDGTEGGTTTDFTMAGAVACAFQVYRISGHYGVEISAVANSLGDTPNPPILPTSWGTADTLWIATVIYGDDDGTVTAYPSSYTDGVNTLAGGGTNNSCSIGSARRELNTDAHNPVAFTLSETERCIIWTIGIRPANTAVAAGKKSFVVQSRAQSGEVMLANSARTIGYGTGSETEGDSGSVALAVPAGVVSNPMLKLSANSLTGTDIVVVLHRNDIATGVQIVIPASGQPTGIIDGVGSEKIEEGDRLHWELTGGSVGTVTLTMLGTQFQALTADEAVTPMQANSSGSSNLASNSTTWFAMPTGKRGFSSTEAEGEFEFPFAGTVSNLSISLGTVVRNSSAFARVAGSNTTLTTTWGGTDDNASKYDSTHTASIAARDKLSVAIVNDASGVGDNNIEKMGLSVTNTAGLFGSFVADDYEFEQSASTTRYYPVAGNLNDSACVTEADAEYEVPFDCNVSEIMIRVTTELLGSDSTLQLRKNGVDVGTPITIGSTAPASEVYYYQTVDVDFAAGDTICFKLVTGTGTYLRFAYMGLVAAETAVAAGYTLTLTSGSVVVTGSSRTLSKNSSLSLTAGSVQVTGSSFTLTKQSKLNLTAGEIQVNGSSLTLVAGGVDPVLILSVGNVQVNGASRVLRTARRLNLTAGSVDVTGSPLVFTTGIRMGLTPGAVEITGSTLVLTYTENGNKVLNVNSGAVQITGSPLTLEGPFVLICRVSLTLETLNRDTLEVTDATPIGSLELNRYC